MVNFKGRHYEFDEIKEKVISGDISEDKDFIIEALRACFFTEDGTTLVDGDGVTILTNQAHENIMGVSSDVIVGKNTNLLVEEGIFQKSASTEVFKTKKQETLIQHLSSGKIVLVTATPIFDEDNNIVRVLNNVRDIPILQSMFDEQMRQEAFINSYKSESTSRKYLARNGIIAESYKMRKVIGFAEKVSNNDIPVLVLGESGVGKNMIVEFMHTIGNRAKGPIVSVNCGAIPENLLESELFGYNPGAFTGASPGGKIGLIEAADGGMVFLDEIGEMPLALQPKLLSFLETGEIMRVGSTKTKKVNCRIVTATNRNLKAMVERGEFREDLFYRLSVIPVEIPPLRERREDIVPLTLHFLRKTNENLGTDKVIGSELLRIMENSDWPGNIRQLKNVIERMVVLSQKTEIGVEDFPYEEVDGSESAVLEHRELPVSLQDIVTEIEDSYIEKALKEGGSVRHAAELLGLPPTTFFRKLNRKNKTEDKTENKAENNNNG